MATKLVFEYDRIGDILFIRNGRPYRGQETDEIDDSVVAKLHPQTDVVECVHIMFLSTRILSHDPFQLNIRVVPGAINGWPAAPEFDCLVDPGSEWLTVPRAAVLGMELDTRPPKSRTYPGNRPADVSRFQLTLDSAMPLAT